MGRVRVADRVDLLFPPRNRVKPVFARGYRPLLYSSGAVRCAREEENREKYLRERCRVIYAR